MKISCIEKIRKLEKKIDTIIAQLKRIANITIILEENEDEEG